MTTLTQESLHAVMHYEPSTGNLTWIVSGNGRVRGKVAGTIKQHGYRSVWIDKKDYAAHRLVWFYVHGEWPQGQIDHINGVRHDNRIANLRDVDQSTNQQNLRRARRNNSSQLIGAHKNYDGWNARIHINGRQVHLGRFKTAEEAHAVYLEAKRQFHAGCTI